MSSLRVALGAVSDDNKVQTWFQHGMLAQFLKRNVRRLTLLLIPAVLFYSQLVFSGSYNGVIVEILPQDSEVRVNVQYSTAQQLLTLEVESKHDKLLFGRLKVGDYISFQAQKTAKKNYFRLTSIDYVGLQQLLGLWTSSDGLCYNFTQFSQLIVFVQDHRGNCNLSALSKSISFPKSFKYFITPNEANWDILVGDRDLYFSAEFNFESQNSIFARIFNTDTGKVDSELTLWR